MPNWKTYVEKTNAKTYVLPEGWDSREKIAEDLECSPEKVNDHLRPGLLSGDIERQQFPVWSQQLGRKVMTWAYRHAKPSAKPTTEQVLALRKAGKSWPECARELGVGVDVCRRIAGAK